MLITLDIRIPRRSAAFAALVRSLLECLVEHNMVAQLPPLYLSGVRYRSEPASAESFRDARATLERGHGDCAHLATWRCAELRRSNEAATLVVTFAPYGRSKVFHVQVRRGDGSVEDPSRELGMQ
jgi:hypothetical protein